MTLSETLGISETQERLLARALQLVLFGVLAVGVVTVRAQLIVTGGITFGVSLLPALLRREYNYSMDMGLILWITVAMILHVAGALALYEQFQWFDEIAHTVSGTLIAGIGYASFRALELHSDVIDVPSEFRAGFILVFVLAAGVFWEVLEFVFSGFVTVYGVDDIVTDFIFNAVGGVIVAVWGTGYARGLVGFFRRRLRRSE